MSGVIVVDEESLRSTCFGRDAYIHDHRLDILITMLNSVNCSTVICLPTVILMLSREATSETYGPRVYFPSYKFPTYFILQSLLSDLYNKNTKNIYLIISIRSHIRK